MGAVNVLLILSMTGALWWVFGLTEAIRVLIVR